LLVGVFSLTRDDGYELDGDRDRLDGELTTNDAQGVYERLGFQPVDGERWMECDLEVTSAIRQGPIMVQPLP
jgi:hypothetical protein